MTVHKFALGRGHNAERPNSLKIAERITPRERDPELDEILVAIAKAGISISAIADRAEISTGTINRWFGNTARPQNYTLNRVWGALGYETIRRQK